MPELPFSVGNYGRPTYGLPTTRVVNCFVEKTPGGPKTGVRIARPGLTAWHTLGSGPILRQFQNPGLFNGDLFTVSGGTLYRNTSSLGSVPYGPQPRLAAAGAQLAIVSGGALYVYNGASLTLIRFFDDGVSRLPPFSSVAVLYNIFVYTVAGSNQFFFSQVGDATLINAANFSQAQTTPDPIQEVQTLAEELYFFKQANATEIWDFTGILTAPFELSKGRTYVRGTPAQGSVAKLDNALFWVGDDFEIYRTGAVPLKVSTPFIDDRLRAAKDSIEQTTGFPIGIEGHWFYVVNLPQLGESYAYDCASEEWAQWGTQVVFDADPGAFIGQTSAGQGATIWIGSSQDGKVWLLDTAANTDDGLTRAVVVSGAIWVTGGTLRLNNVALACVRGVGNTAAPDPQVMMRLSKDGGRAFGAWLPATLGPRGQYGYKAVWRGLGLIRQPGALCEFSVLDAVNVTVEGASFNEARV